MAVPGVLMRLVEPRDRIPLVQGSSLAPSSPCANIEAMYSLEADDDKAPSRSTVYFLSDITHILSSSSAYDEDVRSHATDLVSVAWVVCAFINGRDSRDQKQSEAHPHLLPGPPAPGSLIVINGSTPRTDKEQDYHNWYDQEHGEKLTRVPGWNAARRYRLSKLYGEAETASFYGFNFYDEDNGLGGPEWKAGVTEWTLRIRSNAARPNIRRVWKVVDTGAAQAEVPI